MTMSTICSNKLYITRLKKILYEVLCYAHKRNIKYIAHCSTLHNLISTHFVNDLICINEKINYL